MIFGSSTLISLKVDSPDKPGVADLIRHKLLFRQYFIKFKIV
jgi:hypothetical protein